jgi:hypothetical protein
MNIRKGEWISESKIKGGKIVQLKAPIENESIAVISR